MKVIIAPVAEDQIRAIETWWRANRRAAPDLFSEEFATACELIASSPGIGRGIRLDGILGLRRVLLRATRYHLYYAPAPDGDALFVLAVWSALRGVLPPIVVL
jgi:plasmid stabilization system protein ParE